MEYYAIINTNTNRIISWCGMNDGVTINLNYNELIHEITKEQSEIIGDKEAEFSIEDGILVLGQLSDKSPLTIEPTETELLNQKITTLQEQLDSATEAIDFLLMGGM